MPLNLDNSRTFGQLVLELGRRLGLAVVGDADAGSIEIPAGTTRNQVVDAINDGARRVATAYRWSWLEIDVPVLLDVAGTGPLNVASSSMRLRLPSYVVGQPLPPVRWSVPSEGTAIADAGTAKAIHPDDVRRLQLTQPTRGGAPLVVGMMLLQPTKVSERPIPTLLVWPKPDRAYTIEARFRAFPSNLSDDAERPLWPEAFDALVLAAAAVELGGRPGQTQDEAEKLYEREMANALKFDQSTRVRTIGTLGINSSPRPIDRTKVVWYDGRTIIG